MKCRLQQALFGYDGGHDLLAASIDLAPEIRRFLSVATDLSGSPSEVGFDRSFTGTAVPNSNYYALICTWLAPEMKRPGCVWSHVILVEFTDLAGISNLGAFRQLFVRPPKKKARIEDYADPLVFSPPEHQASFGVEMDESLFLLEGLYDQPKRPAVLLAREGSDWEEAVFALWNQQWPRLRRNFRFSTGSFSDRGPSSNVIFDLQVAPEQSRSNWRQSRGYNFLEFGSVPAPAPWLLHAAEDLLEPNVRGFRDFLRVNGADVDEPRDAFAPIATLFGYSRNSEKPPWFEVLDEVAVRFPSPHDARTLKRAAVQLGSDDSASAAQAFDTVRFLCSDRATHAFGTLDSDFLDPVRRIWKDFREELLRLLAGQPSKGREHRWQALAAAIANSIDTSELTWIWQIHPEFLQPILLFQPSLAADVELWRLPERAQWHAVEILERLEIEPRVWIQIIRAMLLAGGSVAIRELVTSAGSAAFEAAVQWQVEDSPGALLPTLWRDALRMEAQRRIESEALSPIELAFCATLLNHSGAERLSPSRHDVQRLAAMNSEDLPEALRLPAAFLLVMLGLRANGTEGATLLARGFFNVYDALDGAAEPPEAWRLIQPQLPVLWFWQEWDRCEKLRRGLSAWAGNNDRFVHIVAKAARSERDREIMKTI
jgi:hypothetical protein